MGKARREKLVLDKSQRREIKRQLWSESKECGICKRNLPGLKRSSLDHIKPLGRGGADDIGNLQLTHWQCNNDKGDDYE